MIKRVELKNFEIHKHSIIDDFSKHLTLICGKSNRGKTSIVRAIKLVAYNDFEPSSVRTGCKNCEVTVTTEVGSVTVTRGKDNIWDIIKFGSWHCKDEDCESSWEQDTTPDSCPHCGSTDVSQVKRFTKIGKNTVPPLVRKILGFGMVSLGDLALSVNIMNQEESHFMLSGMGDKKATGSVKGTEIKKQEERIEEIISQLHDKDILEKEKRRLEKVEALLGERDECNEMKADIERIIEAHNLANSSKDNIEKELNNIPDCEKAIELIEKSDDSISSLVGMNKLIGHWNRVNTNKTDIEGQLDEMTATDGVNELLDKANEYSNQLIERNALMGQYTHIMNEGRSRKTELDLIPNYDSILTSLKDGSADADKVQDMINLLKSYNQIELSIELKQQDIADCESRLALAIEERDSFDACPLCGTNIESHECLV
jgi:DNA repair exonuclease SbcCD ATPase subunit